MVVFENEFCRSRKFIQAILWRFLLSKTCSKNDTVKIVRTISDTSRVKVAPKRITTAICSPILAQFYVWVSRVSTIWVSNQLRSKRRIWDLCVFFFAVVSQINDPLLLSKKQIKVSSSAISQPFDLYARLIIISWPRRRARENQSCINPSWHTLKGIRRDQTPGRLPSAATTKPPKLWEARHKAFFVLTATRRSLTQRIPQNPQLWVASPWLSRWGHSRTSLQAGIRNLSRQYKILQDGNSQSVNVLFAHSNQKKIKRKKHLQKTFAYSQC